MATDYYFHQANVLSRTAPAAVWTAAWDQNSPNVEGIAASGDPGADGGTGARSYSAGLKVAAFYSDDGSSTYWTVHLYRCNAAGVVQSQASINGPLLGATGSFVATGAANLGTFVAGDRFRVMHYLEAENPKATVSATLEFGPSSSVVVAPWTIAPPAPLRRPIRLARIRRF